MKRPLIIIFSVIAVIAVVSISLMGLFSPRISNTFSTTSQSLGMGGGGGPATDLYAAAPVMELPASSSDAARQVVTTNGSDVVAQQVERKVIKNADLSVVVKDPQKSMDAIIKMAEELGGYVVSSNIYQSTYGPNNITVPAGAISIRIPADKLDEVLDRVKKDAVEVTSENVSGQDVTDQYVDLTSRLSAKQAAETKLLDIMQSADKTEDVLAVYAQLQQVQTDIEVLKGQIKYIDQSVAMSSVSVNLTAEASAQPIEIGGWKLQGTAKESIEGLIAFLQGFVQFLIRFFLNYLWRILLVLLPLFGVYLGGRAVYRRFNKTSGGNDKMTVDQYLGKDNSKKDK